MELRRMKLSMSVDSCCTNMKTLCGFVVLVIVACATESDALITCASCSNCTNGEGTCRGDLCYSQASIGAHPGADDVIRQGCYFEVQRQLCNTSSDWYTTLCCESEMCNRDLTPTIRSRTSTTAPPEGPPSTIPVLLNSCYESDSSRGLDVRLCTLEAFCFSTLRRRSNGTVVHRRGCTDAPCINETRNRKIKRCCTSSLCNGLIQDPLQEVATPTTLPPSTVQSTTLSPQPVNPLITYKPPSLDPRPLPTGPTSAPTMPSLPTNQQMFTCYCDNCRSMATCNTNATCGTLYEYSGHPSQQTSQVVSVRKFCLTSTAGCGRIFEDSNTMLVCCNQSYCNNFVVTETPTTTLPERATTEPERATTEEELVDGMTNDDASSATPTPGVGVDGVNHDIYIFIGIGVFVVGGVILVILVIVVICYCCLTRPTSSSQKAKKSAKASQAGVELAVGMTLSYPSPNIYTKRRESLSVSTDGHSSSPPISEGIPRAAYSSTSV